MTETGRDKIRCNLKDAGCSQADIEACLSALEQGCRRQALQVLEGHRQRLLERYHQCKGCIDCLDYLMIRLEKQGGPHGIDGTEDL